MAYFGVGIAILSLVLLIRWIFRCEHAWEVLYQKEFHSALEEGKKQGWTPKEMFHSDWYRATIRVIVVTAACKKCGTLEVIKKNSKADL